MRKVQEAGHVVVVSGCFKASLYACVYPAETHTGPGTAALQYRDPQDEDAAYAQGFSWDVVDLLHVLGDDDDRAEFARLLESVPE